jgi:hypothetical protein
MPDGTTLATAKISELPVATAANTTDKLEASQVDPSLGFVSRSITVGQLATAVGSGSFLPLAGGTLTGQLNIGTATSHGSAPPTGAGAIISENGWMNIVSGGGAGFDLTVPTNSADKKYWSMWVLDPPAGADEGTLILGAYDDTIALQAQWLFRRDGSLLLPGPLAGTTATLSGTIPPTSNDTSVPTTAWVRANISGGGGGTGTVTSTSVVSANGLAGTVATPTTTPAITLSTTVTGMVKGNGTALSVATAGTDYMTPGNVSAAYQPLDTGLTALSSIATGIVTNTAADTFTPRTITGTAARLAVTNGSGVAGNPTLDIDATYVGQTSITTLGTVATGTWQGSLVAGQYGGTGVANTGKTITLGGNLTTAGAFASTFTMTAGTTVTFPTTGTLATTAQLTAGTVTGVSVVSANGFAGTATATATPAITLTTTVTGMLKGNATAISAAVANTDYLPVASPTCTGTLTGAAASFSGAMSISGNTTLTGTSATGGHLLLNDTNTGGQVWQIGPGAGTASPDELNIYNQGTTTSVAKFGKTGSATFPGAISTNGFTAGYLEIPQNAQAGNYTAVLADSGKHVYHAVAAAAATYTIPANATVAYPLGATLTFVNDSANNVTIAITTDTLVLSPGTTTGSRTLATGGVATAIKVTSTRWIINGTGLT